DQQASSRWLDPSRRIVFAAWVRARRCRAVARSQYFPDLDGVGGSSLSALGQHQYRAQTSDKHLDFIELGQRVDQPIHHKRFDRDEFRHAFLYLYFAVIPSAEGNW